MQARSRMRIIFPMLSALILALASMTAVFAVGQSSDASPAAAQAQSADDGNGHHCEDSDNKGHKDCKPENNPRPENPPCDADHGHPGENSPKCSDRDSDGVADNKDKCPDEPGPAENDGCPEQGPQDSDGDGVNDDQDACPNEPGPAENDGCPEQEPQDSDGDGVNDDQDECPNEPGPAENDGCPEETVTADACTAEAGDPGILTDDTLGQTIYDGGADALSPLTEDPEANGVISGEIHAGGEGTELEPVTDEAACAVDLLLDEEEAPLDP